MIRNFVIFLLFLGVVPSLAQKDNAPNEKVYDLNYKIDIPLTAGLLIGNYFGSQLLKQKPILNYQQISFLENKQVDSWNRFALQQSTENRLRAQTASDWGRNITLLLPALLLIDKKIRQDWLDIGLLYLQTQTVNYTTYLIAGPLFVERARPFVYYPEVPFEEKTAEGATDSWFSGHTSSTAAASFFMAKVYSDYHPELGNKKYWLFAAALIPPAFVGFHRYKALKHFPRDVMVGAAVGAAVGILIPHLHKRKNKKGSNLTVVPYTGKYTGIALSLKM